MWRYIYKLIVIVFHIGVLPAHCQNVKELIQKGDSLYQSKNYDLAHSYYFQIFNSTKTYSPNMLLKMAYINEKKGDLASQLFYLCTLYRHHPRGSVLKKIESIAEGQYLQGYSYSDLEYFISVYKQYYDAILVVLMILCILFCANLLIKKWRNKKLGYRPIFFLLFLAFLYFISNYSLIPPRAILNKNNCLMMEEASASSDVKTIASRGHRITLFGKKDIWYLVNWEGTRYYIKESDIFIIPESHPYLF